MSTRQFRRRALVVLIAGFLVLVAWQYALRPGLDNQYYVQIAGQKFPQNEGGIIHVPKTMWEDWVIEGSVKAHPVNLPEGSKVTVERSGYIEDKLGHVCNFLLDAGKNIVSIHDRHGNLYSRQEFRILASAK